MPHVLDNCSRKVCIGQLPALERKKDSENVAPRMMEKKVQQHLVVADLKFLSFPFLELDTAFYLLMQRERDGVLKWQMIFAFQNDLPLLNRSSG